MSIVKIRYQELVKVADLAGEATFENLNSHVNRLFAPPNAFKITWGILLIVKSMVYKNLFLEFDGDKIELDEGQLEIAMKLHGVPLFDVQLLSCENSSLPIAIQHPVAARKRHFGRFVKEKKHSKPSYKGIGRPCPKCHKLLSSKTKLVGHLQAKYACPVGPGGESIEDICIESAR